jgi:hypothetical protein
MKTLFVYTVNDILFPEKTGIDCCKRRLGVLGYQRKMDDDK